MHRIETLIDLCVKELELCGVHEEESVAVLSHGKVRANYAEAFMIAAARLGARPYEVRLQEAATSATGESGAWTVGATPIDGNGPVSAWTTGPLPSSKRCAPPTWSWTS